MSYYLLPNVNSIHNICNNIQIEFSQDETEGIINKTMNDYLNLVKVQINLYYDKWDNFKKYTNPYEYIHSNVPNSRQSICKLKPLSRSFYKMIELTALHTLFDDLPFYSCKTFHLAEGPGGFIEAIVSLRGNKNDLYYGMTLQDENPNVPGWKKSNYFLKQNPNVIIENGVDETGDLFSKENLTYCYYTYKGSMDLITADGGFDFSLDFNRQETNSINLIYSQICFAIAMQKKGGNFILKVFDLFTQSSIDMIYLLSSIYKKVYITKPNTSRYANSEKYIVCKHFLIDDVDDIMNVLLDSFQNIRSLKLNRVIKQQIPYLFINKLEEFNAIFGQQQIENISSTINLIENHKAEKMETLKKNNINKCILWCQKYKLPYYKNIQMENMFLTNKPIEILEL
jgi:23S rRNA U2552 (ribose-2'-O)-methylase RlmE/FtsJ